jgi:hypothetical protein
MASFWRGPNFFCIIFTQLGLWGGVLEHIFHLLSINLSPRYFRAWSHDSNGPILTNFDQVSHRSAPSLDLRGNMLLLASEGTLPTFFLDFRILFPDFRIIFSMFEFLE